MLHMQSHERGVPFIMPTRSRGSGQRERKTVVDRALEHENVGGSPSELARQLSKLSGQEITRQRVWGWQMRGTFPREMLVFVSELIGIPIVNQITYSDTHLRWIAEHVVVPQERWLRARGLTANIGNFKVHANTSGSASVDWHGRMGEQEWADFNGLCAHIDSWGNDHWDCSVERLDLISKYALEILGGATLSEEDELTPDEKKQLANINALLTSLTPTIQSTYNNTFWSWGTLQPGKGDLDQLMRNTYNRGEQTGKKVDAMAAAPAGQVSTPVPVLDVEASLAQATVQQLSAALNRKLSGK